MIQETNDDFTPLSESEIKLLLTNLIEIPVRKISTPTWLNQHQLLSKLNIQAHLEVHKEAVENVVKQIIAMDKVGCIVHHLLAIETWKAKVYPRFKRGLGEEDSIRIHFLMYHEAVAINLLELILYNKPAILGLNDLQIDLIDYCHRKILVLNSNASTPPSEKDLSEIKKTELQMSFQISINALSILRYLTDEIPNAPLSVQTRMLNDHDTISALVYLMESAPWIRADGKGGVERFEDGAWRCGGGFGVVGKVDGQIWLSLYNLLVDVECQKKYEINSHNHAVILRLRAYLNEDTLTQIPILDGLYRQIEHISLMDPPSDYFGQSKNLIQQIPDVTLSIIQDDKWDEIADYQLDQYKKESSKIKDKFTTSLADLYNIKDLEVFLDDPKCGKCGNPAMQRCSQCKLEWYCGRQCQVQAWKGHKEICNLVTSTNKLST